MKYYNIFLKIIFSFFIFLFSILSCLNSFCYNQSIYCWNINDEVSIVNNDIGKSVNKNLELQSQSAILIEQNTGKILYSKNEHEKLYPASVTKVMSILLIMENLNNGKIHLNDLVPCSENAASMGGSQIWLDPKEKLTVDDMLKAICVNSANDCVVAMAEFIAGSEEEFVQMMNDKAKSLNMNDTSFKNCHGLDEQGHFTSSYDISIMSKELLSKYPEITKYTTIWMDSLRNGKSSLSNTNKLIKYYKGATGLKTGSTSLALYNLSASATRNNLSLIAVIMKAPSTKLRFEEAKKLLDYGFNNYIFKNYGNKGDKVSKLNISKGIKNEIDVILEKSCGTLIKKGDENKIKQNIILPTKLEAPLNKGQKIGELNLSIDNNIIYSANLICKDSVEKINIFSMIKNIMYNWFNLLR